MKFYPRLMWRLYRDVIETCYIRAACRCRTVHPHYNNVLFPVLSEAGVARGDDALTILDNIETRNTFLDELLEVSLSLYS